jgi:hypothetical protein
VRSIPSDEFLLILSGSVVVQSGDEKFLIELGPFNYIGMEALTNDTYLPDFSSQINNYAKVLKIKRADYLNASSNIQNYNK